MTLALDMRFTETAAPLYIDAEGDCVQGLFVIATSQPPGVPIPTSQNSYRSMPNKKRDREDTGLNVQQPKRSAKIVSRVDVSSTASNAAQSRQSSRVPESMPPPSFPGMGSFPPTIAPLHQALQPISAKKAQEPLFLPSSQLSVAETQFLQEAGLGDIETVEDLNALLEGEGEEVDFSSSHGQKVSATGHNESDGMQVDDTSESFELMEEMIGPSQATQKVCMKLITPTDFF
jgi:cell cycle checkpoint control protein RAD9A